MLLPVKAFNSQSILRGAKYIWRDMQICEQRELAMETRESWDEWIQLLFLCGYMRFY